MDELKLAKCHVTVQITIMNVYSQRIDLQMKQNKRGILEMLLHTHTLKISLKR